MGPHLGEVLRELVDRLRVRDRRRARKVEVVDHALEHVRQGQERERHRVVRDVEERRARRHVRHEIPVRQDGALGLSRGAGRVDHRREVAREDGRRALLEGARVGAQRGEALLDDGLERRRLSRAPRHVVEDDHVLQVGASVADVHDLLKLDAVRDEDDLGERVAQDVLDLRREIARVDRHASARRERAPRNPPSATRAGSRRGSRPGPPGRPRGGRGRGRAPACASPNSDAESGVQEPPTFDTRRSAFPLETAKQEVVQESLRGKGFEHVSSTHYAGERPQTARTVRPRARLRASGPRISAEHPGPAAPNRPGCARRPPRRPRRRRSPSSRR